MKNGFQKLICLLTLSIHLGCSTYVTVESSDKTATIYKSDKKTETKGVLNFRDIRPSFTTTNITIEKEGCKPAQYTLVKSDEFYSEAFLSSLFLTPYIGVAGLLPLFWITTYEKKYILNYECEQRGEK